MFGALPPAEKPGAEAYRVLARKYRPQSFDDLIGQEPMVRTLTNAFRSGRIAQAWMLTGVRGVGKTTTARLLARALNYRVDGGVDEPTIDMPSLGVHCRAIMEGRHPDVMEMDAASHTGINDIREIIEQVRYRPTTARYKVYLIDEVHMLSNQAFNGLLKTLEEPPEHVKFIFATTEIRKVPVTVLSRCQRFDLRRIEADAMLAHLKKIMAAEGISASDDALALVVRAGEGSARDSLSLVDQAIATADGEVDAETVRQMLGLADRARVVDLFEHVMSGDIAKALDLVNDLYANGAEPSVLLTDLAAYTHYVTRLKLAPSARLDATASEVERTRGTDFTKRLSVRVLSRAWQMLSQGIDEVKGAVQPLPSAEMVLIRLAHAADLPTPDEALKRLREDAPRPTADPAPSSAGSERLQAPQGSASHGDGPALRAIDGTEGLQNAVRAHQAPRPEPTALAQAPRITCMEELARLAEANRDFQIKHAVETCLRPIRFDVGRIELEPTADAAPDLTRRLMHRLKQWTGERWTIVIGSEGGATIAESASAKREQLVDDARSDPTVAAILSAFPGAEVVDIRLPPDSEIREEIGLADMDPPDDMDDEEINEL